MDMDFRTKENLEDVDVFQIDALTYPDRDVASDVVQSDTDTSAGSIFSLLVYWFSELRWRWKFWNQTRQ